MRTNSVARLVLAVSLVAIIGLSSLGAQASSSIPTRKMVLQVNLKASEQYFLDTFLADVGRRESALGKTRKATSKEKLGIIKDTIDLMLFRQLCEREGLNISEAEISSQISQYKASLGPGATDAMVDLSLRRNGVFIETRSYVKHDLLFGQYLNKKYPAEVNAIKQPSSADLIKAYEDMKFNLRRPSFYRMSMLLAPTQGKTDTERKKAGDAMRAIADKLKSDPSAYDSYFIKGMVDPQAAGYQTMPYVVIAKTAESRSQYPNLYDKVFKLKEGEVSDLIEENVGYCIVRVNQYLPEKQLGLDDFIEGISEKAAAVNPTATVMAYIVNEYQNSKYNDLAQKTRTEITTQTRKDGKVVIYLSNLADQLEQPEIDALKDLAKPGSGYSVELK